MNTRLQKIVCAVFTAVLLTFVAGFAQSAEPIKIRLAWVVPVINWAPILFEKKGIAKHLGKSYVMEPTHFQGTPTMILALASGELEIANLAFSTFALAIQNANMQDLRIIGDEYQDGVGNYRSTEFMVLKDGPVKRVEDLKGRVVATNALGSGVDIAARAMLRKHGLDPNKDVTTVEADFSNMKAMLASKKVDIAPMAIPFALDPQLRAMARTLFTQKDAMGPSQMIMWVARAGFLQSNRAAMVDFMEDAVRAVRWFLDPKNHDEAVQIAARVSKQSPDRFQSWVFTKEDYYRDPNLLPNPDILQANIQLQQELGFLKANIDAKKYVDLSIVQEAARRLK
jgi:NitT/TauT family transport system substrate-binding protein